MYSCSIYIVCNYIMRLFNRSIPMLLSCIVVDDEQHSINILADHIQNTPFLDLALTTTNPIEGLQFAQQQAVDLIFLDVNMPQLSGIQFLKLLQEKSKVIITTAYAEYALEGYEYSIVDYLLKPISIERFLKATQKALPLVEKSSATEPAEMFVKTGIKGKLQKVILSEISYIISERNYVSIYTHDDRIPILFNMRDLEEQLHKDQFIRVHKSFIVAMRKIQSIEKEHILISGHELQIPIGEAYKKNLLDALEHKILRKKDDLPSEH